MIAGYVIAARTLDKCRATIVGTAGDYHFDCRLDNFFFGFAEISANEFQDFVATGASDEQAAAWIGQKAKKRQRIEIIKWNNEWRYKRLSEMPDAIQEFMEDYIPQFVPAHLRHHIEYLFDIYDAEEKRWKMPDLGNQAFARGVMLLEEYRIRRRANGEPDWIASLPGLMRAPDR